jgi:hypothetical protein
MIVSNFKIEKDLENCIILNTDGFQYKEDENKFKMTIEVLNLINTIHWANDFYKNANSVFRIPTDIFHKAIDSGLTNKPFSLEELTAYFNAMLLVNSFYSSMLRFDKIEHYTPFALELVLFGFSISEQNKLSEKQKELFFETYGNLLHEVGKKTDIKTFIESTKNEIEKARENMKK